MGRLYVCDGCDNRVIRATDVGVHISILCADCGQPMDKRGVVKTTYNPKTMEEEIAHQDQ